MKNNYLRLAGCPRQVVIRLKLTTICLILLATPVPVWAQDGIQDITGAWNVKVTVTEKTKKTVYEFGWVIKRIGDGWWVDRMLLKTGNPNQQWMVGKTWNEYSLKFDDGVWVYTGKFGAKDQWASCNFQTDTFSCKGSQREFTITEEITLEGERPFRITDEVAPRATVEVLEVVGDVEISPEGDDARAYTLTTSNRLRKSDRIVTSMDARVKLRFPDGNIVEVSELTDMKVASFSDAGNLVHTRLWLRGGMVAATVSKGSERPSDFAVKTPSNGGPRTHHAQETGLEVKAIAESRPRFTVAYDQQSGVTTIAVTAGTVQVTPVHSKSFLLHANQQVAVAHGPKVGPITGITHAARNPPPYGGHVNPPTANEGERANSGGLATGSFARRDNTTISPPAKTLRYFGSPSEESCKSACATEQGCVAYTFVRAGGYQAGDPAMCYLMSSLGPEVTHSCCVSGFKAAGDTATSVGTGNTANAKRDPTKADNEAARTGFARRDNMTISPPAKILRFFGATSEDACLSSCTAEQGCVAYTFVRAGGYQAGDPPMCYLMSSLGPEVPHSCCVSGFKNSDTAAQTTVPSVKNGTTQTDGNKCIPFHGAWNDTSFGTVITFQRNGSQVTGRYVFRGHDSSISGVVSGNVLDGEYSQPTYPDARYRRGRLRFVLNPDGRTWSGRAWDINGNDEQAWNGACPRR